MMKIIYIYVYIYNNINLIFRMTFVKAKAIETELVIPGNNTTFKYLDISINLMSNINLISHISILQLFFQFRMFRKG